MRREYSTAILVSFIYIVLFLVSREFCYFWDVTQQIGVEAHYYYLSGFQNWIIPHGNEFGIESTGYHAPMLSMFTALCWIVFGYSIEVSHVIVLLLSIPLIISTVRLVKMFVGEESYVGLSVLLLLLEPTVLSQFVVASPDFMMLVAMVCFLDCYFSEKKILMALALILLAGSNMRGVILYGAICAAVLIHQIKTKGKILSSMSPFIPSLFLLICYYVAYFVKNGWFFGENSAYSEHYEMSTTMLEIVKHAAAFVLRNIEQGRFVVFGIAAVGIFSIWKSGKLKSFLSKKQALIVTIVVLMYAVYVLFVFITKMPFTCRYFMPMYFLLTLVVLSEMSKRGFLKRIWLMLMVLNVLLGHLWIYPEKMAQPWDATLFHMSFYQQKKEMMEYIENRGIDFSNVSAGFCLYGKLRYSQVVNDDRSICSEEKRDSVDYFIYSNISNLEDDIVDDLKCSGKYVEEYTTRTWPVFMTLYRRIDQ